MTTVVAAAARVKAWLDQTDTPSRTIGDTAEVDDKVIREARSGVRWNPTLSVLAKLESVVPPDWMPLGPLPPAAPAAPSAKNEASMRAALRLARWAITDPDGFACATAGLGKDDLLALIDMALAEPS